MSRQRRGKIAKLPAELRLEVNRRLHDGEGGPQILPWLNAHERVKPILAAQFEGVPISDQNLSEWRQGGYLDWLEEREKLDSLKEISLFARDATKAGGNIADGAAAVAAGRLITAIESADDEQLMKITQAIAALRSGDNDSHRVRLIGKKLEQDHRKLEFDERKWRMRTVELVMAHIQDTESLRIATQPGLDNDARTDLLGKRLFGEDW